MKKRIQYLALLVICQLASFIAPIRCLWSIISGNYATAFEILKGYDRLANASFNGNSTETISSRANRGSIEGTKWACVLCRILDDIEKDHCKNSAGV